MKIFRNSVCSFIPHQKLHPSYHPVWFPRFYNKVLLSYPLKELKKMQRKVATWILGTFCTLFFFSIEVIAGLISIHLYLCKLSGRAQLRAYSFPHNYILQSLLKSRLSLYNDSHCLSLDSISLHQ